MYIAANRTCSTINSCVAISQLITLVTLAVLFLAGGCGRSKVNEPFDEEEGDGEQDGGVVDQGSPIDAGAFPITPVGATAGSGFSPIGTIPDARVPGIGLGFDATLRGDGSDGAPMLCEESFDCATFNRCEIPVCTASGICSFLPVEDGLPCVNSFGNQICVNGFCQTSSCGDGYLDTSAGEICDDGNYVNNDDCVNCREAICGDGFLHEDDEECEPALDSYCKDDCTLGSCGDGEVTSPAENCEPETDGSACNDDCRLSDEPQWKIEISDDILETGSSEIGFSLLLDSDGQPIVVSQDSYLDDDNIRRETVVLTKYDSDGEKLWRWESDEEDTPLDPSLDGNGPILGVYCTDASIDINDHVLLVGRIHSEELSEMDLPWLAKFDADGHLLWSYVLDQDEHEFFSVAADDQANIMVMMSDGENTTISPYMFATDPSIELFTSDGTYREDDSVAISGFFSYRNSLSSGVIGESSRFMLAGVRENSSGLAAFMALLDSDGQLVWDSPIYYADEDQDIGFARALAATDGDIVVLGKTGLDSYSYPYTYWFERYGPDKTRRYDEREELRLPETQIQRVVNRSSISTLFTPMAVDGDNSVFVAYSLVEQPLGGAPIFVDKYDSDSEPEWERPLLYDTGASNLHGPVDIVVNDQGTIYVLDTLFSEDSISVSLLSWDDSDYPE